MSSIQNNTKKTKIVYAPPPSDSTCFSSIYSITLYEHQEVEWQWLEFPDGNRVVIDYKVIERLKTSQN